MTENEKRCLRWILRIYGKWFYNDSSRYPRKTYQKVWFFLEEEERKEEYRIIREMENDHSV